MADEKKDLIERLEKTATRSGAKTSECFGVIGSIICTILIGAKVIPGPTHWIAQAVMMAVPVVGAAIFAVCRGGLKKAMLKSIELLVEANKKKGK